ncbi:hypothetical protein CBOM_05667 [Ceraceosorus bombacis]|uniref:Uncharacterized protein n=1 Tax=Ceraceosorus bombacis TaxID=401625 RepID=A0A0P1BQ01_9BASI|nr:hypothetical protein CBOM_05667 [Ceraceosorus bombacis]
MGHKSKRKWDPAFADHEQDLQEAAPQLSSAMVSKLTSSNNRVRSAYYAIQRSSADKQASLEAQLEQQKLENEKLRKKLRKKLGLDGGGSNASAEISSEVGLHAGTSAAGASLGMGMEVIGEVHNASNVSTGEVQSDTSNVLEMLSSTSEPASAHHADKQRKENIDQSEVLSHASDSDVSANQWQDVKEELDELQDDVMEEIDELQDESLDGKKDVDELQDES